MKGNNFKICLRIIFFILIVLLINYIFHWYFIVHTCSNVFGIENSFSNMMYCEYNFAQVSDKYFLSIGSNDEMYEISNDLIAFNSRIAIVKNILILIVFIIFTYITLPLTKLIKD